MALPPARRMACAASVARYWPADVMKWWPITMGCIRITLSLPVGRSYNSSSREFFSRFAPQPRRQQQRNLPSLARLPERRRLRDGGIRVKSARAPAHHDVTEGAVKSAFDCFAQADKCEEMARETSNHAGRAMLRVTASQWRNLGREAKAATSGELSATRREEVPDHGNVSRLARFIA